MSFDRKRASLSRAAPLVTMFALLLSACLIKNAGQIHSPCSTFNACNDGLTQRFAGGDFCLCEIPCDATAECPKGMVCRLEPLDSSEPQWSSDALKNICVDPKDAGTVSQ